MSFYCSLNVSDTALGPLPFDFCRAISREAAKKRRRVESDVFGNLSQLLPVQPSVQKSLDKPSIIRLTLSYIRMHTLLKGNVSGFRNSF
uniref:BHLH domain-containing protein n=1 Tax=Cynoglossus semilaevis TaxID=244447 RepID=A0A3P8VHI9_CYNSE